MKKYMGIQVKFIISELGPVNGTVVGDLRDRVLVKGDDGKVVRLIKSKIIAFTPEQEPRAVASLHVLSCDNAHTGCRGVQYIHEGKGFSQADCDAFMDACPCKADNCRRGSKGELNCVDPAFLADMLAGTLFGEFPKAPKTEK